jgi:hypothetical protein
LSFQHVPELTSNRAASTTLSARPLQPAKEPRLDDPGILWKFLASGWPGLRTIEYRRRDRWENAP